MNEFVLIDKLNTKTYGEMLYTIQKFRVMLPSSGNDGSMTFKSSIYMYIYIYKERYGNDKEAIT